MSTAGHLLFDCSLSDGLCCLASDFQGPGKQVTSTCQAITAQLTGNVKQNENGKSLYRNVDVINMITLRQVVFSLLF